MGFARQIVDCLLLLLAIYPLTRALKFDLHAYSASEASRNERCIRNFASKNTMVVVTATIGGDRNDGQLVNMHIRDAVGNEFQKPRDVIGENRYIFTTSADSAFDVCFENIYSRRSSSTQPSRPVELDIDIGADAKDWSAIQNSESLKPIEAELRRIEEVTEEIVEEMTYLRHREIKLRDTNESTNERVKWFAFATMGMLVSLGVWQVLYLRAYFRSKHLI